MRRTTHLMSEQKNQDTNLTNRLLHNRAQSQLLDASFHMMSDDPLHEFRKPLFSRFDPDVPEKQINETQQSEHHTSEDEENKQNFKLFRRRRLKNLKERLEKQRSKRVREALKHESEYIENVEDEEELIKYIEGYLRSKDYINAQRVK